MAKRGARRGSLTRQQAGARGKRRPAPVGLVVEGQTEFTAFQRLSSHRPRMLPGLPPLKLRNCRGVGGHTFPAGVARRVCTHVVALLAANCHKVIVCIDRERRPACCPTFAQMVHEHLRPLLVERGCGRADVAVVVADRAFEAWILADADGLHRRGLLPRAPKSGRRFEGRIGRSRGLGAREIEALNGGRYDKLLDGPRLFVAMDFDAARKHGPGRNGSRSLDKLLRELGV